jgi:hypothetical protein
MQRQNLPLPEWNDEALKSRPYVTPSSTSGGDPSYRIAYALDQIAAAMCRIDHHLAILARRSG